MAEFVNYQIERMLPEYEHMRALGLFNEGELKSIKNSREKHAYKISKQTKVKSDYTSFITFERDTLKNIEERRKSRRIFDKKDQIEGAICGRIQRLYTIALERFTTCDRLWNAHIKFCLETLRKPNEASAVYRKMLMFFQNSPEVWINAAELEVNENDDIVKARAILMRGIQTNPKSEVICIRLMELELKQTLKLNPADKKDSEQITSIVEHVMHVYTVHHGNLMEVSFPIKALELVQTYTCATIIEKKIIDELITQYANKEETWDAMAKRCLHGKCGDVDDPLIHPVSSINCLALCVQQYELGCKRLETSKMMSLYIEQMLNLDKGEEIYSKKTKRKVLGSAFRLGFESKMLSEKHYAIYLKLLMENTKLECEQEYITQVFELATKTHTDSKVLWELWIEYLMNKDDPKQLEKVFLSSIKKIPQDSLSIWRMMMLHYQRLPDCTKKVEDLMNNAIKLGTQTIARYFKPRYIEYMCMTVSIEKARSVYKVLSEKSLPCLEMHKKMVELEMMKLTPCLVSIRKCFEYQCLYFGKDHVEVWIDYIRFEKSLGDPKLVSSMFQRAQNTLKTKDNLDHFEAQFRLMEIG